MSVERDECQDEATSRETCQQKRVSDKNTEGKSEIRRNGCPENGDKKNGK